MGPLVELINGWIVDGKLWPVLASPFIGSFLGVLITRLPTGQPVVASRSACAGCGKALGPHELIPLLSFLIQRGRCRSCGAAIGFFHPQVELAALLIAIYAATHVSGSLLWAGCALGWTLLTLGWIDAVTQRLPDALTLPLIIGGLAEAWALEPEAVPDRAVAAAVGYAAFRLVALLYRCLRGRDGLGQGDAKLLAAGGAWVGTAGLAQIVVVASVSALCWALMPLGGKVYSGSTRIPFGPFLAFGIWVAWFYAP